jgi:hypothetical protein
LQESKAARRSAPGAALVEWYWLALYSEHPAARSAIMSKVRFIGVSRKGLLA